MTVRGLVVMLVAAFYSCLKACSCVMGVCNLLVEMVFSRSGSEQL